MIHKELGEEIQGEKIILEAGHIEIKRQKIRRAQGHRGKRAVGKIHAMAFIDKPFSYYKTRPIK